MPMTQTRRRLLGALSLAAAGGLLHAPCASAGEERLETTSLRLMRGGNICPAPEYVAEEFLRAEGFTEIRFVAGGGAEVADALAHNRIDVNSLYASELVAAIDRGAPITMLAGLHVGCFELFARPGIGTVTELKGRSVAVRSLGSSEHLFTAIIAARVGLDPVKDIRWVFSPKPIELFADGKADAFLGFPPQAQEAHARGLGDALVNSATDTPWSQYFCCMWAGNRDFVRANPVATKRALRAILKAADFCTADPAGAAKQLVEGRFTSARAEYVLQAVRDIPYDRWREYDAEDTVRYYALRLHEIGMIQSDPAKIIAAGTDWRFLDELKRELKA
jgi:NitT/TauT family transport system substrate-binding protein